MSSQGAMEENEVYKSLEAKIKRLEQEVSLNDQKQDGERMSEEDREKLKVVIGTCKQTLKVGSMTYGSSSRTAEVIWNSRLDKPTSSGSSSIRHPGRFSKAKSISSLVGASEYGGHINTRPEGLCLNPHDGYLYVCDSHYNTITRITLRGTASVFVQNGLKYPLGIALYHKENTFFVCEFHGHSIAKVTPAGVVSPFVGSGKAGKMDGNGSDASFDHPFGIAINQQTGDLFVTDNSNHLIRKINQQGDVSTLAGSEHGFADGNGKAAKLYSPRGICFDESSQALLVCDSANHRIRRVQLDGEVSTLCTIQHPNCVAVAANQTILVTTSLNFMYKATPQGPQREYKVEHLAGNGGYAKIDGGPNKCCFHLPSGIAIDEEHHLCFVADSANYAVRKVSFVDPLKV